MEQLEPHEGKGEQLFDLAYPPWKTRHWMAFGEKLTLVAGGAFLLAGIIFFFAFNWNQMPRLFKLALAGGLLLAAGTAGALVKPPRQIALTLRGAAFVLTGALLALFGQVYQIQADSYELFLSWGLLTLPLTVLSGSFLIPLLWIGAANTGLFLFMTQRLSETSLFICGAGAFNLLVLGFYEFFSIKGKIQKDRPWVTGVLSLGAFIWLIGGSCAAILRKTGSPEESILIFLTIVLFSGGYLIYSQKIKRLSLLTLIFLGGIALIFSTIISGIALDSINAFLLYGLILILLTGLSVYQLLKIKQKWQKEGDLSNGK